MTEPSQRTSSTSLAITESLTQLRGMPGFFIKGNYSVLQFSPSLINSPLTMNYQTAGRGGRMPAPASAFDVLHTWVVNLIKIQDVCVKNGFGHGVGGMTLNTFARQKVLATVGNGRNFLIAVAHAIGGFDPDNPTFTLGNATSFSDLTDWVSPYFLLDAADLYIRSTAGRGADVIPPDTRVLDLFSASAWDDFAQGITRANLDSVIGKPADVIKKLAEFHADTSTETYWRLLSFLSTIDSTPDAQGGK